MHLCERAKINLIVDIFKQSAVLLLLAAFFSLWLIGFSQNTKKN